MEIINTTQATLRQADEHLSGRSRSASAYSSDADCAYLLEEILRDVPALLQSDKGSPQPLLAELARLDGERQTALARELVILGAVIHRAADERRTAEYLLRHRAEIASGRRSTIGLLRAARFAAEMDVRRRDRRELPVDHQTLAASLVDPSMTGVDSPSLGEFVLDKLRGLANYEPEAIAKARIRDAVVVAVELAERHTANRGRGPSLLAMRADARKESRLVTYLRAEFGDDVAAANVARLLVGPDGSPIETALLWWTAQRDATHADVPVAVRRRWTHYLRAAATPSGTSDAWLGPTTLSTDLAS
jgi:hypothetical protein